jgi:hypothetical protein
MKNLLAAGFLGLAMGAVALGADNAPQQPNNSDQVRQINYSYKGRKYLIQMSFDAKARAALAANPVGTGETAGEGQALIDALEKRGGVVEDVKKADGTVVPSEQQFSERTGKRTAIIYRRAGKQQDPSPGVPAVQGWDAKTGSPSYTFYFQDGQMQNPSPEVPALTRIQNGTTAHEFYQAGKLEDPQPGQPARRAVDDRTGKTIWEGHYRNNLLQDSGNIPAWQEFDPTTGHLTLLEYCQYGLFEDPANGEPAKQIYDGKTGALISASRCSGGKVTHRLTAQELAALAAKKNAH